MPQDSEPARIDSETLLGSSKVRRRRESDSLNTQDRSALARFWYRVVQWYFSTVFAALSGLRATGREHIPDQGSVLLVSNHLSHLDVLVLGILLDRPLNYVARST